jgi:hypothetical protein
LAGGAATAAIETLTLLQSSQLKTGILMQAVCELLLLLLLLLLPLPQANIAAAAVAAAIFGPAD